MDGVRSAVVVGNARDDGDRLDEAPILAIKRGRVMARARLHMEVEQGDVLA